MSVPSDRDAVPMASDSLVADGDVAEHPLAEMARSRAAVFRVEGDFSEEKTVSMLTPSIIFGEKVRDESKAS